MALYGQQIEAAAYARGLTMLIHEASSFEDLAPAFQNFSKLQVQAVIVPSNGLFVTYAQSIMQFAIAMHLPTILSDSRGVEAGGLTGYGAIIAILFAELQSMSTRF
jgi:ABC-type uncharacterized transport system substrate-binding protein